MMWVLAMMVSTPGNWVSQSFTYTADRADIERVSLVGSFNNWSADAEPMKRAPSSRKFETTVKLSPGQYQYKFVINGKDWITDPHAKTVDDGNGNLNSLLVILPTVYATPAKVGDGVITESAIYHDASPTMLNYDQGMLRVAIDARPGDLSSIVLRGKGWSGKVINQEMKLESSDEVNARYVTNIPWDGKTHLDYQFDLKDGDKTWSYSPEGVKVRSSQMFSVDETTPFPKVPGWVQRTVFYQIFPDRFENGDPSNDPQGTVPWGTKPEWFNWMGGDAAGIVKRKGYLKQLGVNGVYINPVMAANSNHRYDPCDFFKIDPSFATNDEYISMVDQLAKVGIKTVQDQIFDHVGVKLAQFEDLLKYQQNSKYKDWFKVKAWPVEVKRPTNYESWYGNESMPKVNFDNPDVRAFFYKSLDYWMSRTKLAGWRLDVAAEPPQWWWKQFRKFVKAKNPDAWIVGEVWGNSSAWLQGDQFDATMNYPFRDACEKFIAQKKTTPSQFMHQLMEIYNWYAPQISRNQLNSLSTHDTSRFLTDVGNNRQLQKLAAAVQFTWPGAPSIYYGEEIGMEGGPDPDNRRAMEWKRANDQNDMLVYYRKLVHLRLSNPVLTDGNPVPLTNYDSLGVASYARVLGNQAAVVIVNRSGQTQTVKIPLGSIPASKTYRDALNDKNLVVANGALSATVPAWSAAIALPTTITRIASRPATGKPYSKTSNHFTENQQ